MTPGGFSPPLHLHREIAECIYVLAGRLDLHVGDDQRIAVPGTFVGGPPVGVPHTMSVVGEEPVRMLMILSNPGRATQMLDTLEQVFAAGWILATAGPLLAQLDMEILEPIAS